MSYNISTWKTKEINGLVVPIAALTQFNADMTRRGWRELPIEVLSVDDNVTTLTIRSVENGVIIGTGIFVDQIVEQVGGFAVFLGISVK